MTNSPHKPPETEPPKGPRGPGLRARIGLPLPRRVGLGIAYIAAFVLAPLTIAALGFWIMLIPVFALWFGWLPYLCLAGPGFAIALRYLQPRALSFALIGFVLNLASPLPIALMLVWFGHPVDWSAIVPFWYWGFFFAPLWGAAFGLLFRLLRYILTAPSRP